MAALFAVTLATSETYAAPDTWSGWKPYESRYLSVYEKGVKADLDVGANLVDDGLHSANPPSQAQVEASTARIEGWLAPAPEPAPVTEETAVTPSYSGDVGNSTVMCESGGDYGANTGNGYYGGYQFDSGTWDAYGDPAYGEANEAPPAVQDEAAASVPYDAWPNC